MTLLEKMSTQVRLTFIAFFLHSHVQSLSHLPLATNIVSHHFLIFLLHTLYVMYLHPTFLYTSSAYICVDTFSQEMSVRVCEKSMRDRLVVTLVVRVEREEIIDTKYFITYSPFPLPLLFITSNLCYPTTFYPDFSMFDWVDNGMTRETIFLVMSTARVWEMCEQGDKTRREGKIYYIFCSLSGNKNVN